MTKILKIFSNSLKIKNSELIVFHLLIGKDYNDITGCIHKNVGVVGGRLN